MTTFEDRLLDLLLDEVASPSLPPAEEGTGDDRPARRAGRGGRRALAAVGVAATVAAVAGVLSLTNSPSVPVVTAGDTTAPAASDITYLTFGAPTGAVTKFRSAYVYPETHDFRKADGSGLRLSLQSGSFDVTVPGWIATGTAGGFTLHELDPANSGGVPVGMTVLEDPDGRTWNLTVSQEGPDTVAHDLQRSEARAFAEGLRLDRDGVVPRAPYAEFIPVERHPQAWGIVDERVTVLAYEDSTTDIADLDGEPTQVRGHAAVEDSTSTTWRETASLVLRVVPALGSDGSAPRPSADERRAVADGLVPIDRGTYDRYAPFVGGSDVRVVVLPSPGASLGAVRFRMEGPTIDPNAGWGEGIAGADGFGITFRPDGPFGPGATEVVVWAGDPALPLGGPGVEPPACALHVPISADAQTVTVTLDPTCVG